MTEKRSTQGQVLITAFEPFNGASENNSYKLLKLIEEKNLFPQAQFLILPTVYQKSFDVLQSHLNKNQGITHVLSFGEGDDRYRFELGAENLDNAKNPDNAKVTRTQEKIMIGAPDWYFFSWPLKTATGLSLTGEQRAQVLLPEPWVVSDNCGNFVCNHLSYQASHYLAGPFLKDHNVHFQFLHIPNHRFVQNAEELLVEFQKLKNLLF